MGVVGESGCGKSTLGPDGPGLTSATDGKIFFQGEDITFAKGHARRELRKKMQIIFQDPFSSLNPRYTCSSSSPIPSAPSACAGAKRETERKVFELMDTVGLARRFAYAYPHELDGGRRQRIGIARALSVDPNSSSATSRYPPWTCPSRPRCSICSRTFRNRKGLSYIFVTHDMSVVKHISDDILVMYVGSMVEKCPSKRLFQAPAPLYEGPAVRHPRALHPAQAQPHHHAGELTSPVDPKPGCRFANRCPYAKDRCRQELPQYEEVQPEHFVACHYAREINEL